MVTGIILAAAVVGILGILIGIFLGVASEKFKVEVDEREILVRNELPGNNCGGCGYAGCDALAKAIAAGQADVGACPVGGASAAEKIGAIMGVAGGAADKKVAFVKCSGTCDKTKVQYNYYGVDDCQKVSVVPGAGEKACAYGCMGYGSCVKACAFDAIHVVDGVAVVDKEKCVACGKCVASCPQPPDRAGALQGRAPGALQLPRQGQGRESGLRGRLYRLYALHQAVRVRRHSYGE